MIAGGFTAGGQAVNLEHVTALRRFGHDASLAIVQSGDAPFEPAFPAGVEPPPWQIGLPDLTADDVTVVGEAFGAGIQACAASPARRVIHNQNPFYTFQAFHDWDAVARYGTSHLLCASQFTAGRLTEMGWTGPMSVVRPFLDPAFHCDLDRVRAPWIAYMPRKRSYEARLIRGLFRSRRPDLAHVTWIELAGVSRADVAGTLSAAGLFLSLGRQEGLGLPPLEAMASGVLVVGFHGEGGREYAAPENGDWFDEGQHAEIADALAMRMDQLAAGQDLTSRRRAGLDTAAAFSRERFEDELQAAWDRIL